MIYIKYTICKIAITYNTIIILYRIYFQNYSILQCIFLVKQMNQSVCLSFCFTQMNHDNVVLTLRGIDPSTQSKSRSTG